MGEDWFWGYWFMFPISIFIATVAMSFGIGGAAFFSPCFTILFPLVGVPVLTASESFFSALFTELFGFTSGLLGYIYHGLIDWKTAVLFSIAGAPFAMIGAGLALIIPSAVLYSLYAGGLVLLCILIALFKIIERHSIPIASHAELTKNSIVEVKSVDNTEKIDIQDEGYTFEAISNFYNELLSEYIRQDEKFGRFKFLIIQRLVKDRQGKGYLFFLSPASIVMTLVLISFGSLATGVISVGIGETTITSLRQSRVPPAVAAATSVTVTFIVVLFGVGTSLVIQLISGNSEIPWDVIIWTVPGVLIGGQIGPYVGRVLRSEKKDFVLIFVFLIIAALMSVVAWLDFTGGSLPCILPRCD